MVSKSMVNSVMRSVYAGKQEEATPPAQSAKPMEQQRGPTPITQVYYQYRMDPSSPISFKQLTQALQQDSNSRVDLVNKLKNGFNGDNTFTGDYFQWLQVMVVTNQLANNRTAVYIANVSPTGVKSQAKVYPEDMGGNEQAALIESVSKVFGPDGKGALNLLPDGFYTQRSFTQQDIQALQTAVNAGQRPQIQGAQDIKSIQGLMDNYRVWDGRGLKKVDFSQPTDDGVQGGYYAGGQDAFNALMTAVKLTPDGNPIGAPLPQATPTVPPKKTEEDKVEEKAKNIFKPVGGPVSPEKGNVMDHPEDRMKAQDRMQKMAQRVVASVLRQDVDKEAAPVKMAPGTVPIPAMINPVNPSVAMQQNQKAKQDLDKIIKLQRDMAQQAKGRTQTQGATQGVGGI